jgi:hypothetical protein
MCENTLLPCPFCGGEPYFEGNAADWKDDNRYVELSLRCCAVMTEAIGWRRARDMTVNARTAELQAKLTKAWNNRNHSDEPVAWRYKAMAIVDGVRVPIATIDPHRNEWEITQQEPRERSHLSYPLDYPAIADHEALYAQPQQASELMTDEQADSAGAHSEGQGLDNMMNAIHAVTGAKTMGEAMAHMAAYRKYERIEAIRFAERHHNIKGKQ